MKKLYLFRRFKSEYRIRGGEKWMERFMCYTPYLVLAGAPVECVSSTPQHPGFRTWHVIKDKNNKTLEPLICFCPELFEKFCPDLKLEPGEWAPLSVNFMED